MSLRVLLGISFALTIIFPTWFPIWPSAAEPKTNQLSVASGKARAERDDDDKRSAGKARADKDDDKKSAGKARAEKNDDDKRSAGKARAERGDEKKTAGKERGEKDSDKHKR